jgi:hypothetical protein
MLNDSSRPEQPLRLGIQQCRKTDANTHPTARRVVRAACPHLQTADCIDGFIFG